MVKESNQNVSLIQIHSLSFAEFEISEFEISRVDCILFAKEIISLSHLKSQSRFDIDSVFDVKLIMTEIHRIASVIIGLVPARV